MCFFGQGHEKKMLSFSRNNESFLHPDTSYAVFSSASNDFFAQMDQIRFRAFWFRTDDSSGTCHRGKWGGRICWCFAINHGLKRKSHTPDPGVYKSGSFFLVGPSPQNGLAWSQVWEIVWPNLWIRSSENWRGVFVGILDFMQNVGQLFSVQMLFLSKLGGEKIIKNWLVLIVISQCSRRIGQVLHQNARRWATSWGLSMFSGHFGMLFQISKFFHIEKFNKV